MDGSIKEQLIIAEGSILDGIAIDHYGRNIFWTASTDDDSNRIEVAKVDGSHRKILISHNLDEPRDICLDMVNGCIQLKKK